MIQEDFDDILCQLTRTVDPLEAKGLASTILEISKTSEVSFVCSCSMSVFLSLLVPNVDKRSGMDFYVWEL
jgi:hypothetical protein